MHLDPLRLCRGPDDVERRLDHRNEVEGTHVELKLPCGEPRHVEQVVGEASLHLRVSLDRPACATRLFVEGAIS